MKEERELAAMLQGWTAASQRWEQTHTAACLTVSEVADFVDDLLDSAARARAVDHLSHCSSCVRDVSSLVRAVGEFEEVAALRLALGGLGHRVGACLRVFVDEARGAFTRADALLKELTPHVRLEIPSLSPGLAMAGTRAVEEDEAIDSNPEALHEVVLHTEGLPGAVLLCGQDEAECEGAPPGPLPGGRSAARGSLTLRLPEPWEVQLVAADGSIHPLTVEGSGNRYYATIAQVPAGSYFLTILRPEEQP